MERRAFAMGICALVVVACSVWFVNKYFGIEAHAMTVRLWPPSAAEQVETRKLHSIAGWFSLNCGHVRHRENAEFAISCATDALKTRKPFYVSFDFIGLDSTGVIGLAGNRNGAVFQVTTDELGRGAFGMIGTSGPIRTVTVNRCQKPPIEQTSFPANWYLVCLTADGE